jgi:glyoxylase-like metal-dependent hydrolase (beta-lactamase superfamily II)
MRRGILLGALIAVGALSLGARAYQQPPGPKVIEVDKVKDNLYVLKGGGGNTAVFVGAKGVTVVDAKNPGWGQPILDKIKELTPKPVTMLINTHTHGDHVSGNVEFPATIDIIVQDNTKTNMEKMDIFKQNNGKGLPKKTFRDRMTVGKGAEQIDLYYFGPGHTNGDAWVVFPALRAMHAGDMFAGKTVPNVDPDNGGSMLHYAETLTNAINGIKNVDIIINGHSNATTTWADLKEYADFNKEFIAWAQAELKDGKTPEQAAADWKLPAKYQGYAPTVGAIFGGLTGRIQRLADEMKK